MVDINGVVSAVEDAGRKVLKIYLDRPVPAFIIDQELYKPDVEVEGYGLIEFGSHTIAWRIKND